MTKTNKKSFDLKEENLYNLLMKTVIYPIFSLFFAVFLLSVGYGLLMSLIGIRLQEYGTSDMAIGIVNAAFFLGAILSAITSERLITRIGHIRSFGVFAAMLTFSSLAYSLYVSAFSWFWLRGLSGYAFYGMILIIESWLNEKSDSGSRGKVLSIYTIVFYLSTVGGQLMLNIKDESSKLLFILSAMFIVVSLIPVAITRIKEPPTIPNDRISLPKLYGVAKLAIAGSFAGGMLVGGFFAMAPLYAKNMGLLQNEISYFMSFAIAGGLLVQWPIGWMSDRLGRKKTIIATSVFSAIISALLFVFAQNGSFLYLLAALFGAGVFSIYPLSLARANDSTDDRINAVEISRTLLMTYGIGSFLSPLLIGVMMNNFGNAYIFALFALIAILLAAYSFIRESVPFEDRSVYVSVPSASASIMPELDPRQDDEWVQEKKEDITEWGNTAQDSEETKEPSS